MECFYTGRKERPVSTTVVSAFDSRGGARARARSLSFCEASGLLHATTAAAAYRPSGYAPGVFLEPLLHTMIDLSPVHTRPSARLGARARVPRARAPLLSRTDIDKVLSTSHRCAFLLSRLVYAAYRNPSCGGEID